MDLDTAISIRNVSVSYQAITDGRRSFRELFTSGRFTQVRRNVKLIQALQDVSFDVPRGQVAGLIGHNGAGKSTLLRAIGEVLPPDDGYVFVRGHVSLLLSLGLGFNVNLTGRENIRIGGLAFGLSADEIDAKTPEIIEFADIGDFINMPIRTYSSGMRARLAFSVATALEPDILLVDEALSAGDADFRARATERMHSLIKSDRTIVLVSHGLASIRELSDFVVWLDRGRVRMIGEPDEVTHAYAQAMKNASQSGLDDTE